MATDRFHLFSMADPLRVTGAYIYALDHDEIVWTQEQDWLLLFPDHVGTFTMGVRTVVFQPWSVFVVPPGHRCRLQRSEEILSCATWIRFQPELQGGPMLAVPAYCQVAEFGPLWDRRFRTALNRSYQMRFETRSVLTDLVWSIGVDPSTVRQNPAMEAAERLVEETLAQGMRVEDLARAVGLSHNQLIRLFHGEHGVTPQEYIRLRRQHHACRLLLQTDWPVKQVAATVGIRDLAQFNRLVRAASGLSPRELRASVRPANVFRA